MIKFVASFCFLIFLFSTSSTFAQELFRVTSWNIQNFGVKNKHRNKKAYSKLKEIIKNNPSDLWVLQEIQKKEFLKKIFPEKQYVFECEDRRGQHRVCMVFRKGKGLRYVRHPDLRSLQLKRSGLRRGLDITLFVNHKKVRFLGVHLKSGCFQENPKTSKNKTCGVLKAQTRFLERWIDKRSKESLPFFIVGDFNRRMSKDGDFMWKEIDDSDPENSDLSNLSGTLKNTCWNSKYPDFIDHIITDKRATKLFVKGSFKVVEFTKLTQKDFSFQSLSDHCPIQASFLIK